MVKLLLWPLSLIYGFITFIRNKLFDWGFLPSQAFDIPVISVGNLSTGGTGKTPHVEYLVNLLKNEYKVAILSRGYKRSSGGFILANQESSVDDLGDEPFQYFNKFRDVLVAVDRDRVHGIRKLAALESPPDVVLLDDAFQHRYIKPGLSILLTDFYKLYPNDLVLPAGNLREFKGGARRADIIIISKAPRVLSPFTFRRIKNLIKPAEHQHLMFSYIRHGKLKQFPELDYVPQKKSFYSEILLVVGIANPYPLEAHLRQRGARVTLMKFGDHHRFTRKDIEKITETFNDIFVKNKVIVTTEKDMMRLTQPEIFDMIRNLPVCYIPVEVKIHNKFADKFDKQIQDYVRENTRDR